MSTRRPGALVLGLVVVLALGQACSPTDEDTRSATAGLPDLDQQLEAERWALDPDASTADGPLPSGVVLVFDEDRVSGDGGCNRFTAEVTTDGLTSLTIGEPATTLIACIPEAGAEDFDESAATLLAAIPGQHEVDATDPDRLVLSRGDTELVFTAVEED